MKAPVGNETKRNASTYDPGLKKGSQIIVGKDNKNSNHESSKKPKRNSRTRSQTVKLRTKEKGQRRKNLLK